MNVKLNDNKQNVVKRKRGPIHKPIWDMDQITVFGMLSLSIDDMINILEVPKYTVRNEMTNKTSESDYKKAYDRGQSLIKANLSLAQINSALNGNTSMLQFLGRHILNQTDEKKSDGKENNITELEFL